MGLFLPKSPRYSHQQAPTYRNSHRREIIFLSPKWYNQRQKQIYPLAAHNIKIGRRGAIFGAYLKLLPILIFLIPWKAHFF